MVRKIKLSFVIAAMSLSLVGCGGGGEAARHQLATTAWHKVTGIAGLPNPGEANWCYVNTALQLIANNRKLRDRVKTLKPELSWDAFFAEYDRGPGVALTRAHERLVLEIQDLNPSATPRRHPGLPRLVFENLGLPLVEANLAEIRNLLDAGSASVFNIGTATSQTPGNEIRFAALPDPDRLAGFAYGHSKRVGNLQEGHSWAYIQKNGKWYEVNDEKVAEVQVPTLHELTVRAVPDHYGNLDVLNSQGLNVLSYQ